MPTNPLLPLSTLDEWERQEQDWIQFRDPESRTASKILALIADLRTLTAALDAVREERDRTLSYLRGKILDCGWDERDGQLTHFMHIEITKELYEAIKRADTAAHAAPQGDTPR